MQLCLNCTCLGVLGGLESIGGNDEMGCSITVAVEKPSSPLGKGFLVLPFRTEKSVYPLKVTPHICSERELNKLISSPEEILVESCLGLSLGPQEEGQTFSLREGILAIRMHCAYIYIPKISHSSIENVF